MTIDDILKSLKYHPTLNFVDAVKSKWNPLDDILKQEVDE